MQLVDVIGFVAGLFTTTSNLPQVIKTYRTRSAADLSLRMVVTLTAGLVLWEVYGVLRNDTPIIVTNAAGLSLVLALLVMKLKFGRADKAKYARDILEAQVDVKASKP